MASTGWGLNVTASAMRKKRRTIGGFRGHAMGDVSFDTINNDVTGSSNFSLRMVPEDQLSCLGVDSTGSDHIVVAVRVRPLSEAEVAEGKRSCCDVLNGNTVVIRKGADPSAYLRSQKGSINEYTFDAAFPAEAGQSEVYEGTAKPYIAEILDGMNVTVFAYGATGAGKTHTMMGSERVVGARAESGSEEVSGIVPQSLVELFRLIHERMEDGGGEQEVEEGVETWAVRVGYLQVYNEQIYDLLTPSSKPLKINEDPSKGVVVVAGLAELDVRSSKEVLDLLRQGNANRRTEATGANQVSSRSHAVLQVMVTRKIMNGQRTESVRESKLSLIDLAGSERASATNNRGEQLRQAANINKSLLSLANCINALAANRRRRGGKGNSNVKYRDSKLTHLLKASLEGRCRLVMIANVNPSHVFFDDSHNTLKYANRAKNIKVDPKMSESVRGGNAVTDRETRLAKEYQALKERNALVEAQLEAMRNSRGFVAPEPAGFTDLFAPNTSSIMSVASSTPGGSDRYDNGDGNNNASSKSMAQQQQPPVNNGSRGGGGGVRTRSSFERTAGRGVGRDEMPPPAPRGGTGGGALLEWNTHEGVPEGGERERAAEEEDLEEAMDSEGATTVACVDTPEAGRVVGGGNKLLRSAAKRKRGCDDDCDDEKEGTRRGAELMEVERERAYAELAAERTRVRELEGKVRELESSMARMGEQHDITMELVETWRNQKETADEAAEEERATVNELLGLLKEKEREVDHLRMELAEAVRPTLTAENPLVWEDRVRGASLGGGHDGGDDGDVAESSARGANSKNKSKPGTMMLLEGDSSAFLTVTGNGISSLEQIKENGTGEKRADDDQELATHQATEDGVLLARRAGAAIARERRGSGLGVSNIAGGSNGSEGCIDSRRESNESPAVNRPGNSASSAVEMASAIKSQRRASSMIPRSRKSMIPPPRSSCTKPTSQRRLGDVTNKISLSVNSDLNGMSNATPAKKATKASTNTGIALSENLHLNTSDYLNATNNNSSNTSVSSNSSKSGENGGSASGTGSARRRSSVRSTPRAQTQRVSIAGRTRSRLSAVASTGTSVHVRDMR